MKAFVLYTIARLALFAAAFGLIWLLFARWLEWSAVSALYTAIVALIISSVASLFLLRSLRDEFAAHVARRADRAKAAYDARRAAEDDVSGPSAATDTTANGDASLSERRRDDAAGQ